MRARSLAHPRSRRDIRVNFASPAFRHPPATPEAAKDPCGIRTGIGGTTNTRPPRRLSRPSDRSAPRARPRAFSDARRRDSTTNPESPLPIRSGVGTGSSSQVSPNSGSFFPCSADAGNNFRARNCYARMLARTFDDGVSIARLKPAHILHRARRPSDLHVSRRLPGEPEMQLLGMLRQKSAARAEILHLPIHLDARADGIAIRFRAPQTKSRSPSARPNNRSAWRVSADPAGSSAPDPECHRRRNRSPRRFACHPRNRARSRPRHRDTRRPSSHKKHSARARSSYNPRG